MAVNKKLLLLNTSVSYLRTLLSVCLSLLTTRWVMAALGSEDYGLYFLVGGLVSCVAFINVALSAGAHRYFAHSMDLGVEVVRTWFTASVALHILCAVIIAVVAIPVGFIAFEHWFVIPADRVLVCKVVYWAAVLTACCGVTSVPFTAMYTAKQRIFELTIIQMLNIVLLSGLAYAMFFVHGDRLLWYALYITGIHVFVYGLQVVRSFWAFDEARFVSLRKISRKHILSMVSFSWWKFVDAFSFMARGQGIQILFNRFGTTSLNASYAIANQLACQTNVLSSAVNSALSPGVIALHGSGNVAGAGQWCVRMCRIATILATVTFVPIFVESESIVRLWLVNPPEYCGVFVKAMALMFLVTQFVTGGNTLVLADGDIGRYERWVSLCYISGVMLAMILVCIGIAAHHMIWMFLVSTLGYAATTVVFASRLPGFSFRDWGTSILGKGLSLVAICLVAAYGICFLFSPSFLRIVGLVIVNAGLCAVLAYGCVLTKTERSYLVSKARMLMNKRSSNRSCGDVV